MKFEQLSDRDMNVLVRKVEEIAKMLLSIHEIIQAEALDPSDPDDNVVQLVPNLTQEYEANKNKSMRVIEIATLYEKWTKTLYQAVITNKGHLRNAALSKHMEVSYGICKSIEQFLKNLLAK